MELQGHVLIPEFYILSPHVYKWCKTSTVVFLIQNKHLFYGKNYTLYLHRQPIFSKQQPKLKLTLKSPPQEAAFKLFQENGPKHTTELFQRLQLELLCFRIVFSQCIKL